MVNRFACENLLKSLVYILLQYDKVKKLSHEEESAFKKLAEFCTGSQWTITSAQDGLNVISALCMIVEQVCYFMIPNHIAN